MQNHRECHFLSVLTDRVHQPLTTVRVVPLYQMCGRVAYLRVAVLPHIAKVCEKFMNFERIFLYEPCVKYSGVDSTDIGWHAGSGFSLLIQVRHRCGQGSHGL